MNSDPQISEWIEEAKAGGSEAIAHLWKHFFPQLVQLARQKLVGVPRQMADEEDVALSAFKSFCRAAQDGRFPDLLDRDGLWRLLFQMTARKAISQRRRETSEKRGKGQVKNEAHLANSQPADAGLDQLATDQNTPEFLALMAEACEERLKVLTPQLRRLALAKLEGDSNREAAERLGSNERSVEYGLKVIRKKWTALENQEIVKKSNFEETDCGSGS